MPDPAINISPTNATGLVRGSHDDLVHKAGVASPEGMKDATALLDGINDIEQIRTLAKQRFGVRYTTNTNPDTGDVTFKIEYDDTAAALDNNQYEALPTGLLRAIVKRKATLFTQQDLAWSVTIPGEDEEQAEPEPAPEPPEPLEGGEEIEPAPEPAPEEPPEETAGQRAETTYLEHMLAGRGQISLIRADRLSVALGVSVIRLLWRSGAVRWETISPWNVCIGYSAEISDNGVRRSTVTTELDDATVVVIRLEGTHEVTDNDGQVISQDARFVAYWGRSMDYPKGRCCTFHASKWDELPDLDASNVTHEYRTTNGEVANPLSLAALEHPDEQMPEYPIMLFHGSDSGEGDTLFPDDGLSLAHSCREIDLAIARALMALSDASVGITKIKNDSNAAPPQTTRGTVMLEPGQDIEHVTLGAGEAKTVIEGIFKLVEMLAENHDIPGFEVVPDESAAPESGVALAIRAAPKEDDRNERARLASYSVERMWWVLKGLLYVHADAEDQIPMDAQLTWDCGSVELPQAPKERIEEIQLLETAGYIDHIEAIRRIHRLETRAQAEAMSEEMFGEEGYAAPGGEPDALASLGGGLGL